MFRSDLLYRINGFQITLAPLRDRPEDIDPLSRYLLKQIAGTHPPELSEEAFNALRAYTWPGNVRQLRNAIETMVVLDQDGILDVDDLPPELADVEETAVVAAGGGPVQLIGRTMDDIERWAIENTLALHNGNREETAKTLAIGARTLYRKLEKYREDDEKAGRESRV